MSDSGWEDTPPGSALDEALGQEVARFLEQGGLLVALADAEGALQHLNPALHRRVAALDPPPEHLADLFCPWSRARIREESLPAVLEEGLWEGGVSMRQPDRDLVVRLTLVTRRAPTGDRLLALMVPHFGTTEAEAGTAEDGPDLSSRLAVPLYQETRFLDPAAIGYLEAHGPYTQIFLDSARLMTSTPLSSFPSALPDSFLRTHRSYIVNMDRVQALLRRENRLLLRLDTPDAPAIPVSRRREPRVRRVLDTAHRVTPPTR
ncbi:LytR/AlgR family response regulator transcription factor [Thiohalorhabdus denitrificans]|uniref:LytTr DNA-binding domain-containing protein n=1 Tax=Thiohalorhabdus denitrificans TaxID=381306 RepID=A0A1G5B0B3_9GAMM|nr:LytTR family DNA-binding domain-containing protein [Thiohalorhabdus denitrificans]SCX83577.1 LytTr DNA-binding domain-containing protein [Thiohalorhabdus denitrificans]